MTHEGRACYRTAMARSGRQRDAQLVTHGREVNSLRSVLDGRLRLIGRAMLEVSGLRDEDVRAAFDRLREGLDATETRVLNVEGRIEYSKPLVAWGERRAAAQEILKLAEMYPQSNSAPVGVGITFVIRGLRDEKV